MAREMLWWKKRDSHIKGGVSITKEVVFVDNVNQMAKFIVLKNTKYLTRVVLNKYFWGLVVNEVCK